MALDRRVTELVRSLDQHQLRQLVILAQGRLQGLEGPSFATPEATGDGRGRVSYRQKMVRCGKRGCTRCPHGPYWYASWREGGRVRTRYVGRSLEDEERADP